MLKKIRNTKVLKKALCLVCSLMMLCLMSIGCFAAEGTTDVAPADAAKQVFNSVTGEGGLNMGTILSVIGVVIAAALVIVLGWWGIRKAIRVVMTAFRSGKLKV